MSGSPTCSSNLFPIGVAEGSSDFMREHGFQVQISTQRSRSRGRVWLGSPDPDAAPRMRFNYLEAERDLVELRAGFRHAREILAQPAMREFCGEEISPGSSVTSDRDLDAFIRRNVVSSYHPCGTCRMGRDPMSVVDPEYRVHGVEGLRVADASIMPLIASCNLNCPTLMIGEKAADLMPGARRCRRRTCRTSSSPSGGRGSGRPEPNAAPAHHSHRLKGPGRDCLRNRMAARGNRHKLDRGQVAAKPTGINPMTEM